MLDDLFISDATNLSSIGDIELSQDKDNWGQEIQSHIIESAPVLAEIPGNLSLDMFDEDKGYIKGSYVIPVPSSEIGPDGQPVSQDSITVPVLVKGGKMFPPDVYIYKGEFRPMDNDDLAAIFSSPNIGEELMAEEDIPDTAYEGFTNQINPPGLYGSGAVNVIKSGSVNQKILHGLKDNPGLLCKIGNKRKFRSVLGSYLDKDEIVLKKASQKLPLAKGNEVVSFLGNGRYRIKAAALIDGKIYERQHTLDQRNFNLWAKTSGLDTGRMYKDFKSTGMSYTWDVKKQSAPRNNVINKVGSYTLYNPTGKALQANIVGRVKIGGFQPTESWLAIDSNRNYSLQDSFYGKPFGRTIKTSGLNLAPKVADTFTFKAQPGYYAEPIKIASITAFSSEEAGNGFTVKGIGVCSKEPLSCIFLKHAGINRPVKVKHIPSGVFAEKNAEAWMLPANYEVIKLAKSYDLAKSGNDLVSARHIRGKNDIAKVAFIKQQEGNVYAKVNGGETQKISTQGAMSLLKQAGVNDPIKVVMKMSDLNSSDYKIASMHRAEPIEDIFLTNLPMPKLAYDKTNVKNFPTIDPLVLVKVASEIDNEEAMSDVLSIAYADPTNLAVYKEHLPSLKETEEILSRLLITARLGQQALDEKDVRSALFQLHGIIKALETEIQ